MGFTTTLKKVLFSSGGIKIIMGLTLIFIIFGVIGFFGYKVFKKKYIFRYGFLVIDALGNIKEKKARITKNKQQVEVFEIEGIKGKYLPIQEPNLYFNNKPKRVVAWDGMGEIAWCTKIDIDKVDYLKTALKPSERQQGAQKAIEAGQKYGRMPNEYKVAVGLAIVLTFVMIIGLYVNGKLALEATEQSATALTSMKGVVDVQSKSIQVLEETLRYQEVILRHMKGDGYNMTLPAD